MAERISFNVPKETAKKLQKKANKKRKDSSTKMGEVVLNRDSQQKNIDNAIELYKAGQVTGWKAASLAGISLWKFYEILNEKGVLIQYSEKDLEEDLKP